MGSGGGDGQTGAPAPPPPHVVLVGLPGVGKTTIGRALAARLGRPFLDFDEEIERREGRSVARIFGELGEAHFRAAERALTEELRGRPGMVLSPGGGWIAVPEVVALLRPPARVVYLRASPRTVVERMGSSVAVRPLLAEGDSLAVVARLLERRSALYEAADHVIDTELLAPQRLVEIIAELVSPAGWKYVNP